MQLNVACLALLFVATTVNGFVGMSNYERKLLSSLAANNVEKRGLAPMASSRWALPQYRHSFVGESTRAFRFATHAKTTFRPNLPGSGTLPAQALMIP